MAAVKRGLTMIRKSFSIIPNRLKTTVSHKLVYSSYGDPAAVVTMETEELQPPGPGKVLVQMLAAPVNPADINTIQGVYPVKPPLPSIPGNEGVGCIKEVGDGVKNLKVGDLVLPRENAWGTWRSFAVCDAKELMKVTGDLDVVAAATMSVNPCTAYRMLKDFVDLSPGDVVIQNGANSACGQSVIQLCKAWGFKTVNIVRNRSDIDQLKNELQELGADYVLTEEEVPKTTLFKDGLPKPKLGLNCVGGKNALEMLRHLEKKGVMVTYGGMSREPVTIPTSALIFKDLSIKGYWMTRWNKENSGSANQAVMLTEISNLSKAGKWKPPTHELMPLTRFKDVLEKAMAISGKTGRKYIFDFSQAE
ncbi:UNVERIFIED_CONTAM: hypothetical protein PYX00_002754 [Menopon gallinae]|uniref:Enoyl-[acyl-carrier-protein] reductase, mitochondrial n=1 Tax=Menopon gallinae TaxID=328185 RepID=A0AAW2HYQ2_9NEOP